MSWQGFVEVSKGFYIDSDYIAALRSAGIDSMDAVFAFDGGDDLGKANLARYRSRRRFVLPETGRTCYLKRYDRPPIGRQIRNWVDHLAHASTAASDWQPAAQLASAGIKTARIIAYGEEWNWMVVERRSFVIMEEIANARSLEDRLPQYFYDSAPLENVSQKREFIEKLADFARRFHDTGLRHRDFYLCHIFMTADEDLYLIDLQRTFRPMVMDKRLRVKDIAQLHYSAPGRIISSADRLRFYLRYVGQEGLTRADRCFLKCVRNRAWRMAEHDIKHGRRVPFAE